MRKKHVKVADLIGKLLSLKHQGRRYTATLVRFDERYLELSEKHNDYVTLVLPIKGTEITMLGHNADEFFFEELLDWEDKLEQLRLQGHYIHEMETTTLH